MATAHKATLIPCRATRADLGWLLLEPGVTDERDVFGHDPDRIKQLRVAPEGSYA